MVVVVVGASHRRHRRQRRPKRWQTVADLEGQRYLHIISSTIITLTISKLRGSHKLIVSDILACRPPGRRCKEKNEGEREMTTRNEAEYHLLWLPLQCTTTQRHWFRFNSNHYFDWFIFKFVRPDGWPTKSATLLAVHAI